MSSTTTSEPTKRTADERASSPIAGEPDAKRPKQEEAVVEAKMDEDPVPVALELAAPEDEIKVDLASLPADAAGVPASTKGNGDFKEEPYVRPFFRVGLLPS